MQGNGSAVRRKHWCNYRPVVARNLPLGGVVVGKPGVKEQATGHRPFQAPAGKIEPTKFRAMVVHVNATIHHTIEGPHHLFIVLLDRLGDLNCLHPRSQSNPARISGQVLEHFLQSFSRSPSVDPHQRCESIALVAACVAKRASVFRV